MSGLPQPPRRRRRGTSLPAWARRMLALSCAALTACATDHFDPQPLSAAAIADTHEARTLNSADLLRYLQQHGTAPPPERWNLEALTLTAFHYNPELEAARARLATVEASRLTAAQRPNPTLQLPLQGTLNPQAGTSPWTLGFALDIPIETDGRRTYRINQASQLGDAARFSFAASAWSVRSRLRSALLALWHAEARETLLLQQAQLDQDMAARFERRRALGDVSPWEASQQQLALMRTQGEQLAARRQADNARAAVATTLGVGLPALDAVALDLSAFEQPLPPLPARILQRQALLNRADVAAALAQFEASQSALQVEIARQYPNITLGPGYTFDQGARRPGFTFGGLELPLFNRNEGPIAEARGRRREAEARIHLLESQALVETDAAMTECLGAQESLRQREAQLAEQARQLSRLHKAFAAGQEDRLAVALAERLQLAARLSVLDARLQVQNAVGRLEDALQQPLTVMADDNRNLK